MVEEEEVVLYVVRQLAAFRDPSQIAKVIAERGVIDYNDAEKFVRQVEKKHRRQIALARLPIILVAGTLITVVGLALTISSYLGLDNGLRAVIFLIAGLLMFLGGVLGTLAAVYPILEK